MPQMHFGSVRSALAAVAFVVAGPVTADTLNLAHTYRVDGRNPNGSSYKGTVTVEILSNTTFAIKWLIGGETYTGFGMRRNDALAATYTLGGQPGLVIYQVQGDGLDGLWSVRGQNGSGTEHLTPE